MMHSKKRVGTQKGKIKTRIKKRSIFIIALVFTLSIAVTFFSTSLMSSSAAIFEDQFYLSFLGSIAGLSIAIITLLFSNVEKIRDSIFKSNRTVEVNNEINQGIKSVYNEIKENTIAIFSLFLIAFFLILVSYFDPVVSSDWIYFLYLRLQVALKITISILSLIAMADTMLALFNLINIVNILDMDRE